MAGMFLFQFLCKPTNIWPSYVPLRKPVHVQQQRLTPKLPKVASGTDRLLSSLLSTSQKFLHLASKHAPVVMGRAEQELFPLPKLRARCCLPSAPEFLLFVPRHESKSQIQIMRAEGQLGRSAKDNGRGGEK